MSKKILLTGVSSGFGMLAAEELINAGHNVVGTVRSKTKNPEATTKLEGLGVKLVEMDVTNEDSVNNGVKESIDLLDGLDVVVNNAGRGVAGMQEHFTTDEVQQIFDVNVFGVHRITRAVAPFFRKQGSGYILNVSSLLGRITLPFYGPYNASKWALEAMTENYRMELSKFGVDVGLVQPGGFPTEFGANLLFANDPDRAAEYGDFMNMPAEMGENFGKALMENEEQRPEKVSKAITELIGMEAGKRPFRTTVDYMGMGDHVSNNNDNLHMITQGIYQSMGIDGLLTIS